MPTDGRRRGRSYDAGYDDDGGYDDGAGEEPAGYDDDAPNEAPGWAEERSRRTPARRSFDRPAPDDSSEEMTPQRDAPRPGPRRRGGPDQAIPPWDDHANPLEDPRAPPGLRGPSRSGPARRSGVSGPPGASRGRGPARFESDPRRGAGRYDPPGYTEEGPAARYDGDEPEGYSEEYEARPRYPDERRGPPPGARGPRSAPGANRQGRGLEGDRDGYGAYGAREDYGRPGEYGRAPARAERGPREMGGFDDRYADASEYGEYGNVGMGYPPVSRGGPMARAPRGAFEESSVWSPPGPGVEVRRASKTAAKPRSGAFALAFRLFTIVIVVVGLVVLVGPEVAPKLGKYLPFLRSGALGTPPPTFATYTPGPTPTNLPNYKLFTNTANGFAMEYPASWGTSTATPAQNDTVYQFIQPNSPTIVIVERSPTFDSATNAQLIQAEIQGAQAQGMTLTQITAATTTEGVGGEIWQRQEYQATTKNGAKMHIAILATHHLGKGYVIALIGTDSGFTTSDTTTFEPMLRSFRFL